MLRSMYSGISGMKVNQTKLDVIGNNIANVNTTSYKSSRATFSDLLSQSSSSAQASSSTKGGINAKQVGLGVQLSSIDRIMTQGSMQTTSRSLDLGLDGNGYFMVSTGPVISGDGAIEVSHAAGSHAINEKTLASSGASISYTRDGSFTLDNEGNLLTTDGYRVLGYSVTNDDNAQTATFHETNTVTLGGSLSIAFGPGTQLNGCTIRLGKIAAGTPTSAKLTGEDNNKVLTINGDFSRGSNLNNEQITKEVTEALLAKGISQTVKVSGQIPQFDGITSAEFKNGSDASAPEAVTWMGLNVTFAPGSELNKYKIVLGDMNYSGADAIDVQINSNANGGTITVNADFLNKNIDGSKIAEKINAKLAQQTPAITQTVTINGTVSALKSKGFSKETKEFYKVPSKPDQISIGTLTFDAEDYTSLLNGRKFEIINDKNLTDLNPRVEGSGDKIVIRVNDAKAETTDRANIEKAVNNYLSGALGVKVVVGGAYSTTGNAEFGKKGENSEKKSITVGGLKISLPSSKDLIANKLTSADSADLISKFNSLKFNIVGTQAGTAEATSNGNSINIKANFDNLKEDDLTKLARDIEGELKNILNCGDLSNLVEVTNDSVEQLNGIQADIDGGSKLQPADPLQAYGLNFSPTAKSGAMFNKYKIQIGDINESGVAGKNLAVTVDKKSNTIVLNGNFANGSISAEEINRALKDQLTKEFGPGNYLEITNPNEQINLGLEGRTQGNNPVSGGTSVQSLAEDGTVRFVSASTKVKAYDKSLKSLKIPEKVLSADGQTEVAVKSYSISSDGVITATLQDGTIAALGQIALASFSNPAGLTSVGGNLYSVSPNSGSATIMSGLETTGEKNSDAYGKMLSGYLEMSNVDLAEQFTDMITTTKAFQGSSKMITTGDEILSEIINLKR